MRWQVSCSLLVLALALALVVRAKNGTVAPSPLLLGSSWDVPCGDSGLCSDNNPICCGSSYPFCISGGQRCCSGKYPGQVDGSISSCGLDQECCVGGREQMYTVSCCNRTQSCQDGQCVEDICSNTTNADFCVSHPGCEWCCSTNRCQRQGVEASCTGEAVRRTYHERCADNCSGISVCSDCVRTMDEFSNSCTWCAQSQSCVNSVNINSCSNNQFASNTQQCNDIGPTGHGLSHVEQQHSDLGPIILATLAITVFLVFALSVIRIILHRRRMRAFLQMVEVGEGSGAAEVHQRGHGAIARFGFQSTTTKSSADKDSKAPAAPSQLEMSEQQEKMGEQEVKLVGPDAIQCPLCGCEVQLPNPSYCPPPVAPQPAEDHPQDAATAAEGGEQSSAATGEGEAVNSVAAMRDEVDVESEAPPTTLTREARPQERTEHPIEHTPAAPLAKLVLMLPCYHIACVTCAKRAIESGIEKAKAAEAKKGPTPAASAAPAAQGTEAAKEGLAAEPKKPREETDNHTECPQCRKIVECLLIPSRIIRN